MARTSKMNMIMHGDGHGGIYHHSGFININGIFEERFKIVMTNPPFGSIVSPSNVITEDQVKVGDEEYDRNARRYGSGYKQAQARVTAAQGKPIASLFQLPRSAESLRNNPRTPAKIRGVHQATPRFILRL